MPEEFNLASRAFAAKSLVAQIVEPSKGNLEVQLFHMEPLPDLPAGSGDNANRVLVGGTGGYSHLPVAPDEFDVSADGLITIPNMDLYWDPIPEGMAWSAIPTWARVVVRDPNGRIIADIDIQDLGMAPDGKNRVRLPKDAFKLRPMPE